LFYLFLRVKFEFFLEIPFNHFFINFFKIKIKRLLTIFINFHLPLNNFNIKNLRDYFQIIRKNLLIIQKIIIHYNYLYNFLNFWLLLYSNPFIFEFIKKFRSLVNFQFNMAYFLSYFFLTFYHYQIYFPTFNFKFPFFLKLPSFLICLQSLKYY